MSQYFKRMAARCKPRLIAGLPAYKQAANHSADIEVHDKVVAATGSVPPKVAPATDSGFQNKEGSPVVTSAALSNQTIEKPVELIRLDDPTDQQEMNTVATDARQNINVGEPFPRMISLSENIDKPGHVSVKPEPGIAVENILQQENELKSVNDPEPENNFPETNKQANKQPPASVKLSTAVESKLPESGHAEQTHPEQKTFIQPVEVSTYNREITIAKLAGDKQAENRQLPPTQPLTPTLVKGKPSPQTTTEHRVNIKIGKIELEVHQPQAPAKPVSVKPAPRSNRQHPHGNNLSRYYLRGGMD